MNNRATKTLFPIALASSALLAAGVAIFRPYWVSSSVYLEGFIFLEILLAAIWSFRPRYFPLLIFAFLLAGVAVPFQGLWSQVRWVVLIVGAMAGYVVYIKDRTYRFSSLHLVASFAVLAALVSALVSALPTVSILKALSLFLLFLYASSGARLAIVGREQCFFGALLSVIEMLTYISAASYFLLAYPLYGNPNSLGTVMGVVFAPLLLWNVLTTSNSTQKRRRTATLLICVLLLFFSQARAAILAGMLSCSLLCVVLRRWRVLLQGSVAVLLLAVGAIFLTPAGSAREDMPVRHEDASISSFFLYKGRDRAGVLGSRATPWQETAAVIREHPWFGSGFGTSIVSDTAQATVGKFSSNSMTTREHGNSYLAITEWVGLLGVTPFALLIALLAWHLARTLRWAARTGNGDNYCVPVALVLIAGLVHAGFEDWLFAVGYYLCVFFWVLALSLPDLLPPELAGAAAPSSVSSQVRFSGRLPAVTARS